MRNKSSKSENPKNGTRDEKERFEFHPRDQHRLNRFESAVAWKVRILDGLRGTQGASKGVETLRQHLLRLMIDYF